MYENEWAVFTDHSFSLAQLAPRRDTAETGNRGGVTLGSG
jgi:hypothetical protein